MTGASGAEAKGEQWIRQTLATEEMAILTRCDVKGVHSFTIRKALMAEEVGN